MFLEGRREENNRMRLRSKQCLSQILRPSSGLIHKFNGVRGVNTLMTMCSEALRKVRVHLTETSALAFSV